MLILKATPRIAMLVSFSGQGGVEKMMTHLAHGLIELGVQLDLLLIRKDSPYVANLPEKARFIDFKHRHAVSALPEVIRYLNKEQPNALLAAKNRANLVAILAKRLAGVKTRVVARMGTTTSVAIAQKPWPARMAWRIPMKLLYPMADAVVAVSDGVAKDMACMTGLNRQKIHVLPNPVITPDLIILSKEKPTHPWLIKKDSPVITAVGRLTEQKDFATLLHAFALARKEKALKLVIFGEGQQRAKLESLACDLGVAQDVALPGFTTNPYREVGASDLFVLSSRWEGSPNALTEALALGIPVVATDCPSGPREILGQMGNLVPVGDPESLAQVILATLTNPPSKAMLQQTAAPYTLQQSAQSYLQVLLGI